MLEGCCMRYLVWCVESSSNVDALCCTKKHLSVFKANLDFCTDRQYIQSPPLTIFCTRQLQGPQCPSKLLIQVFTSQA